MNTIINELLRLVKQFFPALKAYFNRIPAFEQPGVAIPEEIPEDQITILKSLLTPNKWSRPGKLRKNVQGIEVHWVANPNTSAKFNQRYFEMRKGGKHGFGSTQYIIDLDGDIFQIIPDEEIAYSSGSRHYRDGIKQKLGRTPYYSTLSIECTHTDWQGTMTDETYEALTKLCVHLCKKYNLTARHLYLHYDITGKDCHKWFILHPDAWAEFKNQVDARLKLCTS